MSDSERDRRRLGDATRQRIDELADGWGMPGPAKHEHEAVTEPIERSSTEEVLESVSPPVASRIQGAVVPELPRPAAGTPPPAAAQPPTPSSAAKAPPPPRSPAAKPPTPTPSGGAKPPTPAASGGAKPPTPRARAKGKDVPTAAGMDPTLPAPTPPRTPSADRDDATEITPSPSVASASARNDDATQIAPPRPDRTATRSKATGGVAALRLPESLPRNKGILGDARYVFTVLFGVSRARRELATARAAIDAERARRDDRVRAMAREAIGDDELALASVHAARETLAAIEDDRSRSAGGVAAADAEIAAIRRDRADEAKESVAAITTLEAALAQIATTLEPLERDAARVRKRAAEHRATLAALDQRIAAATASLTSVKAKVDTATVQSDLASLRADRQGVEREEPEIAAELHALEPRIASLVASRKDAELQIRNRRQAETDAIRRVDERIAAVTAQRTVEERGVIDADRERDTALLELGEELCAERPAALRARLDAIDEHDLAIATRERRALELGELIGGVDRRAMVRGVAFWVVVLAAIGVALFFVLR